MPPVRPSKSSASSSFVDRTLFRLVVLEQVEIKKRGRAPCVWMFPFDTSPFPPPPPPPPPPRAALCLRECGRCPHPKTPAAPGSAATPAPALRFSPVTRIRFSAAVTKGNSATVHMLFQSHSKGSQSLAAPRLDFSGFILSEKAKREKGSNEQAESNCSRPPNCRTWAANRREMVDFTGYHWITGCHVILKYRGNAVVINCSLRKIGHACKPHGHAFKPHSRKHILHTTNKSIILTSRMHFSLLKACVGLSPWCCRRTLPRLRIEPAARAKCRPSRGPSQGLSAFAPPPYPQPPTRGHHPMGGGKGPVPQGAYPTGLN